MEFNKLAEQVKAKKFAPVYYLWGDESFFIDKLARLIEDLALNPGEDSFNKAVFYGSDASAGKVMSEVRSFPMMAERRLVMLKEAHRMKKDEFEKLLPIIENPVGSTVLVITWKDDKLDGRTKISKALGKHVNFESKKFYENQVGGWIQEQVAAKGYKIQPEAVQAMVAYLGTNLSHIDNELEKLFTFLTGKPEKTIQLALVYDMINVDKDFNVFELMNSLGARDHSRSHFIITQMMRNVKENPPVMIVFQLFGFFNKLSLLQSRRVTSELDAAAMLKLPRFVAKQYLGALRQYKDRDLQRAMVALLEADLLLKGVQATHMSQEHVMKTLVYKVLN